MFDHLPPFRRRSVALALYRMLTGDRFDICAVSQCLAVAFPHPPGTPAPYSRDEVAALRLHHCARFDSLPEGLCDEITARTLALVGGQAEPAGGTDGTAALYSLAVLAGLDDASTPRPSPNGTILRALVAAFVVAVAAPAGAQGLVPETTDAGDIAALVADTSSAALRIEHARLDLARTELAAAAGWQRWRPTLSTYLSVSSRGIAFPTVGSGGYDPATAALARWPGDTWGLTVSWSPEGLLDRRPVQRARAAVVLAEARVDLVHARRNEQDARQRERDADRQERDRDRAERLAAARRRADHAAALLQTEAGFLRARLVAQRDLLRLAELTYAQGMLGYEALARQRLAVLAAEHALATNAARLAAARDGAPDPLAVLSDSDTDDAP